MNADDIFGADPIADEQVLELDTPVEVEPVAEQAATPIAEPAPLPANPEPIKPEPGFVPLAVALDERDRRKKVEAENERLRAAQQPQEPIDIYDPEQLAAQQQGQLLDVKLNFSEEMTRDKFGDELVDKARDWATQRFISNPEYQQEVLKQRNPWKYVVEQYQRDQIASQVSTSEFKQFRAWQAAQSALAAQTPAAPVAAQTPPVQPPTSLASVVSAGSITQPKPNPVEEKLNAMF